MIKKSGFIYFTIFALVLAASVPALAKVNKEEAVNAAGKVFSLPAQAVEKSPGVYYLGEAIDPGTGQMVEGYAFIKRKDRSAKFVCGNGICEPGENANKCPADCGGGGEDPVPASSCYGFLARGAKWKNLEDYMVDPTNSEGLGSNFVASNMESNIIKWEEAAGTEIIDSQIPGIVDGADTVAPDDKNEVLFGDIDEPGVIAVTMVWGIFGGPPQNRHLVEWDMIFDEVDYNWSDSGAAGMMDFENIATHELGHAVGLDDLYTADCSDQTMFGYADYAETNKRTLEAGDITGVYQLYH